MLFFVAFSVFFVQCVNSQISLSTKPCTLLGQKSLRSGRIVGGTDAVDGETPYIVSLTRRGGHFCGGSILNENWILTAGHCTCNGVNKIMKPTQLKGVLGLYKISETESKFEINFDQIVIHPDYQCAKTLHDIALLRLQKSIQFSERIQPICVSELNNQLQYHGSYGTVSGWGWTNEDQSIGKRADTLQKAAVEIWKNEKCEESYRSLNKPHSILKSQLCAGKTTGGIDSCWADSGGPLVDRNNILIGVVSTGIGCARPGLPGIYTRVSEYTQWIKDIVF